MKCICQCRRCFASCSSLASAHQFIRLLMLLCRPTWRNYDNSCMAPAWLHQASKRDVIGSISLYGKTSSCHISSPYKSCFLNVMFRECLKSNNEVQFSPWGNMLDSYADGPCWNSNRGRELLHYLQLCICYRLTLRFWEEFICIKSVELNLKVSNRPHVCNHWLTSNISYHQAES